jgi:hypothetical protein
MRIDLEVVRMSDKRPANVIAGGPIRVQTGVDAEAGTVAVANRGQVVARETG